VNGHTYDGPIAGRATPGQRIYIIEFSSGVVKAGRSISVVRRMQVHQRAAAIFGVQVARYWVSEDVSADVVAFEARLLSEIAAIADTRIRDEYFAGVSFEICVNVANRIRSTKVEAA
jgi:hypothetical protein